MSPIPFQSEKQKGYLLAHPEITDKKGKPVGRKWAKKYGAKVSKGKEDWGKAVVAGTAAGALANQFPRVQDIASERKRRKKAKISKLLVPVHDDPNFNQEAAQKAFDLVMKMDDDTAEVFCYLVATELLDDEIEKNLGTLQAHLDEVIAKQLVEVKKAVLRSVSKSRDEDAVAYAQALEMVEKSLVTKANDDIPNWMFERKINRDPGSGRFRTKISQTGTKKPIPDKTYAAVSGDKSTTKEAYTKLSRKEKAKYQNEYLQVARFLDAVKAGVGTGNADVMLHYRDDATGETWVDMHTSGKPPANNMLQAGWTVTAAEAKPNALTVGGAAFSLSGAMGGGQMTADQIKRVDAFDAKYGKPETGFANQWLNAGSGQPQNANAPLYGRTAMLGQMAGTLGADGGKIQLAGKMAEIVGQYGPQAEQVLGPSARKAAYRYRGTERAPDKRLVNVYSDAIEQNKRLGPLDPWTSREEAKIREARGPKTSMTETGVRAKGTYQRRPQPATAPAIQQMVAERESRMARAPKWQERELGRRAVESYLSDRLPRKDYYKLHLEAGNTPPSEGVIINADGQITTQASGYGDDHYLPFNLKNLKDLKGGEYIRNRSVGGLTSEDIYTGLISGARRVTVVSRSGTFTMEFQPDFRGGRRHNDKARRMTRRYEQILDAVQSEQVERQDVPPRWKKIIEDEVREEYGPSASKAMVRTEIDARIKDFKEKPEIEGRDMDRAEAEISRFETQQAMGLVSREDVANYRKEVLNELRNMKEIRFRLNGVGYQAALDSLEEQFPYYIHSMSRPKVEHLEEFERDLGYVEPARNRPTAAKAGWHGTATRRHKEMSGKFSAAHADYQRGLPGTPEVLHGPKGGFRQVEPSTDTTTTPSRGGDTRTDRERRRDEMEERFQVTESKEKVRTAAVDFQQAAKGTVVSGETPEWWNMDRATFQAYVLDDKNLDKVGSFIATHKEEWQRESSPLKRQYEAFNNSQSAVAAVNYSKELGRVVPGHPYKFPGAGDAFRPNPPAPVVKAELRRIDGKHRSLVYNKPLSELTDEQLQTEVRTLSTALTTVGDATPEEAVQGLGSHFADPGSIFVSRFFKSKEDQDAQFEAVHKVRYLKRNPGTSNGPSAPPPQAPPPAPPPPTAPTGPPTQPVGPPAETVPVISPEEARKERIQNKKAVAHYKNRYAEAAERKARDALRDGDDNEYTKWHDIADGLKVLSASDPNNFLDKLNQYDEETKLALHKAAKV